MKLLTILFSALCAALAAALGLWMVWMPSPASAAEPAAVQQTRQGSTATILFTHDLHAHFLPKPTADGTYSGGYARLKSAIDRERERRPDALVLDGGDFSVGSLVQTLYTTQAAELRTMGAMGYDAAVIGNHEFDHKGIGFARMLQSAKDAQEAALALAAQSQLSPQQEAYQAQYGPVTVALPALLDANYYPASDDPDGESIRAAMERYGVAPTMLLERGGVKFGIFGLMGVDADECAPTSGFVLQDPIAAAQRCVEELKAQGAEVIICLSHSGTGETILVSEDEELARAVAGIDVIVSGHTHTLLEQPLLVKDTYIVSAGPYCANLGSMTLRWENGRKVLEDYRLIPIDETLPEDAQIAAMVETWKETVGQTYLERYDLTYDQVLTETDFALPLPASGRQENSALGTLAADAFLWAQQNLARDGDTDEETFTFAVTADGVLRSALPPGPITTSMAFDVLSMGVGEDDTSGFPLVAVYISGKELKAAMEVDASVAPIMPTAQLYMSGVRYAFNTRRMFFNRVYSARLAEPPFPVDFSWPGEEIDDQRLYRVVTGMYLAQMLGTVQGKSMGLLNLTPKYADGTPVTDFNDCILYDAQGSELKEWYALAAYLRQFDTLPQRYADADACGAKHVSSTFSPREILSAWNWISWAAVTVIPLLLAATVLLVRLTVSKVKKRLRRRVKHEAEK